MELGGSRSSVGEAEDVASIIDPSAITDIDRLCSLLMGLRGTALSRAGAIETLRARLSVGFWDRRARRLALGSLAASMSALVEVSARRGKKSASRSRRSLFTCSRGKKKKEKGRGQKRKSLSFLFHSFLFFILPHPFQPPAFSRHGHQGAPRVSPLE